MQSLEDKGKIRMTSQDDAASCVNVTGTDRKTDAWLTRPVSPSVRRQLLTLAKVHGQSYYRAALMPVIRAAMARLEART